MKKINYKEKGITLIALVITIIILLILAGVTIGTALGQNGLFQRAKYAVEKYKESEEQEQSALGDVEKELDEIIPAGAGEKVSIPKREKWDESKVYAVADGEGNTIPVPNGFYYAGGSETTGFVISDVENDDLDNKGEGNQFVWIPCTDVQYEEAKNDVMDENWSCNNYYKDNGNLSESKTGEGTGDGKAWRDDYTGDDKTVLDNVYTNGSLPTDKWQSEKQTEVGKESVKIYGGFYIARYEAGIPNEATFSISKTKENDVMSYVDTKNGQFNTEGWSDSTTEHRRGSVVDTEQIKSLSPVSKKGMQAWNYITQPNSKLVSENMYKESGSVGSYLVDSQAWNHICKNIFKANNGQDANDSSAMGNYFNNTTTRYEDMNCLWAGHKYNSSGTWTVASEYKTGNIKEENYPKGKGEARIELSTGASNDFKKYNIYDMAGNMWEWTTSHNVVTKEDETKDMFVVVRGGSFISSGTNRSVVHAGGNDKLTNYGADIGFRVILYIKNN